MQMLRAVLVLLMGMACGSIAMAQSDDGLTQVLEAAAAKAKDGREALTVLAALLSREDASATALDALRERVLASSMDDAVLLRYAFNNDGALARDPDKVKRMRERLDQLDPGNANSVLAELNLPPFDVADPEVAARIARAAAATHYAADFGAIVQAGEHVLAQVEWPATLVDLARQQSGVSPAMVMAVAIAAAIAAPQFQRLVDACDGARFPERRADCWKLGQRILADASTLVDQQVAAEVLRAAATQEQKAQAEAVRRRVHWQSAQAALLLGGDPDAKAGPERVRYGRSVLERGELSALHELFASKGVPLDPPADWSPLNANENPD